MNKDTQLPAEAVKCPECGGLNGGHGNRMCSLMTLEYAQREIINVEQKWIQICVDNNRRHQKSFDRLKKDLTFFQGKVAVLKAENNKLRKSATEYAIKLHQASALLKNVFTRYGEIHEWDREIFNDIKTFLDGTQHK